MRHWRRRRGVRGTPIWVGVIGCCVLVYLLVPVAVVVMAGLSGNPGGLHPVQGETSYFQFPPKSLSLHYTSEFLHTSTYRSAYVTSLLVASVSTAITIVLAFLASVGLSRARLRGRAGLELLFLSPVLVPGTVLGYALYVYLGSFNLRGSFWALVTGAIVVTSAYPLAAFVLALRMIDTRPEMVARTLGAGPIRAFVGVTLPSLRPVISGMALLVFILTFGAFDIFLFLAGPSNNPLSLALNASLVYKFDPSAAGAGVFSIGLVVIVTLALLLISGRKNLMRVVRPARAREAEGGGA